MKPINAYTNVTQDDWVIAEGDADGVSLGKAELGGAGEGQEVLSTEALDNGGEVSMVKSTLPDDSGYLESRQPDPKP